MQHFKSVLGNITEEEIGVVLPHEHIYCYSEYLYQMAGNKYLDKEKVFDYAVQFLKTLKEKYGLRTFIDCTPVNIGRDIAMLKRVSEATGINIICSTGFYFADEILIEKISSEILAEYIISDAINVNAGIIKCAAESENLSQFNETLLRASAKAQLELNIPIVMHTNAWNKNGLKALEILLSEGVKPQAVTVSHLSDTEDIKYIKDIAKYGCYIGLDRLYENHSEEYINSKLETITKLCQAGYSDKILLSHDALFFNGFTNDPQIDKAPRLNYCFDVILPNLPQELSEKIMLQNPLNMLKMI